MNHKYQIPGNHGNTGTGTNGIWLICLEPPGHCSSAAYIPSESNTNTKMKLFYDAFKHDLQINRGSDNSLIENILEALNPECTIGHTAISYFCSFLTVSNSRYVTWIQNTVLESTYWIMKSSPQLPQLTMSYILRHRSDYLGKLNGTFFVWKTIPETHCCDGNIFLLIF